MLLSSSFRSTLAIRRYISERALVDTYGQTEAPGALTTLFMSSNDRNADEFPECPVVNLLRRPNLPLPGGCPVSHSYRLHSRVGGFLRGV